MFKTKRTKALEEQNDLKREELALEGRKIEAQEKANKISSKVMQMMHEDHVSKHSHVIEMAPPEIMSGVIPQGKSSMLGMDSCQGMYDYAGTGDPSFYGTFLGYPTLALMSQSSDYRAVPETTAKEMTREWGRLKLKDDENLDEDEKKAKTERISKINDAMEKHDIRSKIRSVIEHDMTLGRGQLYVRLKHADPSLPMPINARVIKKGSLDGFRVIDPMWTTPSAYNANDPLADDFYVPNKWFVLGKEVHSDRLLTMIMRPVTDMLKPAYNFGGISMLQLMKPYVQRYQRTADSISEVVHSFSMTILATDMANILADGDSAAQLFLRAGMLTQFKSNSNALFLDKDSEEVSQINTPLTGLPELFTKSHEQVAAPSHMPLVVLTGATPGGLNASSEGEIRIWYDHLSALQEAHVRPILKPVIDVIQLDLFGDIDDSIHFEFNDLYQLTDKERAEVQEINSRTIVNLTGAAVVNEEEARTTLTSDENSPFASIKASEVPEKMDLSGYKLGGENEDQAQADSASRNQT